MEADDDRKMVHVRLPKALIREIDHLAVDMDTFRNKAVEQLLTYAVEQQKTGRALIKASSEVTPPIDLAAVAERVASSV